MTTIDLSRLPFPAAIQPESFETLLSGWKARFLAFWDAERVKNPALPAYDMQSLETDPAMITGEAWSYLRLLDRQRVNDAVKAIFAPTAQASDLDNIAASRNVQRLVVAPATQTSVAIMETDAALLRRYLLSFGRASAGSRDALLYQAWTAWPEMGDAKVNGHAVHGRRGDIDVVVSGPSGRDPSGNELARVRTAILHPASRPEAVALTVLAAKRRTYRQRLTIEVPIGPDVQLVKSEAKARVRAAADARCTIGGEIPSGLLAGAAFGASIIRVLEPEPLVIASDPYTVPVLTDLDIEVVSRTG